MVNTTGHSLCTDGHECGKYSWTLSVSVQRDMSVVNTTRHSLCTEGHECGKYSWTLSVSVRRDMSVANTTGHSQSMYRET